MAPRFASVTEEQILSADYSTCVAYTKTFTHLSVGESADIHRFSPTLQWIIAKYSCSVS